MVLSRPGTSLRLVIAALAVAAAPGCEMNPADRCGPDQELHEGSCRCGEGTARSEETGACEPCGDNETSDGTACVCLPGYARSGNACEAAEPGQGEPCDATTPCEDPIQAYCKLVDDSSGYCTASNCSTSTDCHGGYACDKSSSPNYCKRPPLGQGSPCESPDDCAGTEATYCESISSHQCLVAGCSLSPDDCFEGWECCDLSTLGLDETLCVPSETCPTD